MAWVSMGSANLVNGSAVYGYVYFEYNNESTARACRLRIAPRSGYTFQVYFNNVTVNGVNYGSAGNLTQNSGTFWTGNLAPGGTYTAKWTNPWYAGSKTPTITGTVAPIPVTIVSNIYGSVNGVAKKINKKIYGSVNGTARRIVKLYGSANGVAKLIYKDET